MASWLTTRRAERLAVKTRRLFMGTGICASAGLTFYSHNLAGRRLNCDPALPRRTGGGRTEPLLP